MHHAAMLFYALLKHRRLAEWSFLKTCLVQLGTQRTNEGKIYPLPPLCLEI